MRPLEPDDPRSIRSGDRRYRLLARIGSGGMGDVYFGRSAGGRAVAIKLVHPELAEDHEFRRRFQQEATFARAVGGGFTVPVLDADPAAGVPWLVTEFLPSVSLAEAVRKAGPLPTSAVWSLAAGVAEALRSIHGAGIVHRDLKPANVLLTSDGPRVIDFGIARAVDAATVTHPGLRTGSPGFMSPEQVAGVAVEPASDIFSLGSTLAFACTGAEPFGEGTWQAKMARIESEAPLLDGIADSALRALVGSCLDRDPARRPTADQLIDRITAVRHNHETGTAYWLPPQLQAEISRQANEAANPPVPSEPDQEAMTVPRRTSPWIAVGIAVTVLAAGSAAIVAVAGTEPAPGPSTTTATPTATPTAAATTAESTAATPTVRTSPATRGLEFFITGDVKLMSLTYAVNGRSTTLRNVKLPWRRVVTIPASPQVSQWQLRYRFPAGRVKWRVLVNGFEYGTGGNSSASLPSNGGSKGAV
ncbi:serine/threonine-protein kinase [Nonomuraea sp. NPDC046802]|uniref:serine/threonine-protein kinase n=1 Tax=Nonomuraea sp. NPDC046802 TaxID=3154919 RepID=UPI0033F83517